ncbi:3-phenylpropionate-dihydrodiol/cinnamic acid-dihydrodiol dehydrogenase [Paraburkholderia nemoris]|jgi:Short-chain dehydrogenases of various substrate specificities|uniref:SDR family oxidoreductase n=1 Tax=Paraburkholderia nemoris TaxID=2793076 RepID=UPI001909B158|nr:MULTISPECIES: SDR family oxidoreductase [Paraburkholderia]MBK5150065.1 SDR family oxidoreductase [Burkholderia sp. R-69608]MBK3744572.1 SDR family oxidoreductase [Paraburkholderia aspalathi]MBK3782297.1 SDR family oxidoreductase [Paraburkholderia aspalathi]CAE6734431.1 3-phenylpropionate-dihydrodiol/cinnamic acid-dihydrodiol dehydrogenase [Paraburkholderia nemoris]CAE6754104.1 3-phenylpropionate-dihydrodiol/cinnamic acid-dihydrodiol dehydrogenase [Paraburkholderia nemoris]
MMKTWFITGTSSGLGRLLAERLLQRGDRVVATLRHEGALDELKQQYDDRLHVLTLDVTDTREVHANISAAFEAMGRIDVVVNNAGYGLFGAAEEVTDEQIERQIATNLTGSIQVIRAALPHLRRQGGGRIVQVSSEGGQIAYPNFSLYHATKWGIEGFVESVAKEVGPFGIDFVIVEPGPTSTQFGAGLDHAVPMPEYDDTPAGDVRRAIASNSFAIRGDAGKTVTAMIVAADSAHPPLRLTLGGGAYDSIRAALAERLRVLEAQKDIAFSVDSIS